MMGPVGAVLEDALETLANDILEAVAESFDGELNKSKIYTGEQVAQVIRSAKP